MKLRVAGSGGILRVGDLVTVRTMSPADQFCILAFKEVEKNEVVAVLKALFADTYIIEKPVSELNSLLIRGRL
ncbi:MAG: hypothetical protein ACM3PE_01815 [Deltaproteobacteria bacterium]